LKEKLGYKLRMKRRESQNSKDSEKEVQANQRSPTEDEPSYLKNY